MLVWRQEPRISAVVLVVVDYLLLPRPTTRSWRVKSPSERGKC